jgi:deoxycytidylate deaminase
MDSFGRLAKKAAKLGRHSKHRVGAVIIDKNRVISTGFNDQSKTHPMVRAIDPFKTLHAEIHALIRSGEYELRGATVIVYRELKTGEMAMARPCSICQKLLKERGVTRMIYSSPTGWQKEDIA